MIRWLAALLVWAGVCWALAARIPVAAAPEPLVEEGRHYLVVWACLPQVGCYGEVVKVEKVRPNHWVDVQSCKDDGALRCRERWRSNLNQAISVQRYTGTMRAVE